MINISDAELEVMKVLWKAGEAVNGQYVNQALAKHGWKRTTISTFLSRLAEKEAVSVEKRGNQCFYQPLIAAKDYRKTQTKNLITNLYNGSVREFAVSLFEEGGLSDEDLRELRAVLEEQED